MGAGAKRLLFKLMVLLSPAFPVLCLYVAFDPFKVLRQYRSYYSSGVPSYVTLNFDVVATETFLQYYKKNGYDSFIFGNSRSRFFQVDDWEKHISSRRCYHFDASAETLFGITSKVQYLDRLGVSIDNALLVVDEGCLSSIGDSEGHLFVKDPKISGASSFRFQAQFLKAFCDPRFLSAYLCYTVLGRPPKYLAAGYLSDVPIDYNLYSNECQYNYFERMIERDSASYYTPRLHIFYRRNGLGSEAVPVLEAGQISMLTAVKAVLAKDHTNYKIIISPVYDQERISRRDLQCLRDIFGSGNVFDYSGVNKFTENYKNYYESSHYRPQVARKIMDEIYRRDSPQ